MKPLKPFIVTLTTLATYRVVVSAWDETSADEIATVALTDTMEAVPGFDLLTLEIAAEAEEGQNEPHVFRAGFKQHNQCELHLQAPDRETAKRRATWLLNATAPYDFDHVDEAMDAMTVEAVS